MDPFLGEIRLLSWPWPPRNWAICDGTILSIAQNTALFSLLGTMYGGNGQTTFALPDLRGRTPIHRSNTGTIYVQGETEGVEQVTLTISTMPMHPHALMGTSNTADKKAALNNTLATDTSATADFYAADTNPLQINPSSVGPAGGSLPHMNMQPYLVLNYCIALRGVFPSRN